MMVAGAAMVPVFAQDEEGPGRGVARLGLMQGDVSVRRGSDTGEWLAAAPNVPLVVEDRLLTGVNSKAEVQLDYANYVRMAENSEIRFTELEYGRFQLQLARGVITARVLRNSEAEVEISTPSVSVRPSKKGSYRILVQDDGTTEVTVRSGEVDVATPRGTERLKAGRTMLVRGSVAEPEFQLTAAVPRDGWDQWNEQRDQELERSNSYKYVSTSVYGAEDLDQHGQWVDDPGYGNVWVPTVAADWAPYRHGRWTWVDWYGWSWVSYDPWGWAPYHYGRWYRGNRGWCWWPGAIRSRHYWSPGLVAWVGFGGGGVGVGIGGGWGRVGWVPLAPHEPFYRWYGRDYYRGNRGGNFNQINIVNNVNITNVYRNARVANGVSAVNAGDFRNGRYTAARLTDSDFRNASVARGQVPVTPERANLRMADRDAAVQARGGASADGRFFSRRSPAAVDRVSFDEQRRGLDEGRRRTFGEQAVTRGGGDAASPARSSEDAGRGWRRAAEPAVSGEGRGTERTGRSSEGWRRFGEPGESGRSSEGRSSRGAEVRSEGSAGRSGDGNWRRFGDPASGDSGSSSRGRGWRNDDGGVPAGRSGMRQSETPRAVEAPSVDRGTVVREGGRTRDQGNWRSFDGGNSRQRNTDMNPSIVRERGGSGIFNRGGGDRPARMESPRMEAPRMESPRMESRPRVEGGGRSSGGDGGGARSNGGGGGGGRGGRNR